MALALPMNEQMQHHLRIYSWNIRQGGGRRLADQVALLRSVQADVICLQETGRRAEDAIRVSGTWPYVVTSHEHISSGPHRYGVLVASKYPLREVPWQGPSGWEECGVTAELFLDTPLQISSLHVPNGSANGWAKADVLEAAAAGIKTATGPRVLYGDLNTPQLELPDGRTLTWGEVLRSDGTFRLEKRWERLRDAEWMLLRGLEPIGVRDLLREVTPDIHTHVSWYWRARGREIGRRFDHAFGSREVRAVRWAYDWSPAVVAASDHALLFTELSFQ